MNHIVNISTDRLWPHPENPRKDLGDLTELAESVRKNGIMQNLTIVPLELADPDAARQREGKNYTVLIGHRRLAAAKLAGIKELPCRIEEGMDKREQVSTMLEENMHRSDLTVYEQAQGFQMMMDLGETEASIAEKTGFSKRTIRRRLNIARLDQEELQRLTNVPILGEISADIDKLSVSASFSCPFSSNTFIFSEICRFFALVPQENSFS